MISGKEVPYHKFNHAFLICLPKIDAEVLDAIRAEKALSDTTEAALKDIVDAYAGSFA